MSERFRSIFFSNLSMTKILYLFAMFSSFPAIADEAPQLWSFDGNVELPSYRNGIQSSGSGLVNINDEVLNKLKENSRLKIPVLHTVLNLKLLVSKNIDDLIIWNGKNLDAPHLPGTLIFIRPEGVSAWIPTRKGVYRLRNGVIYKEVKSGSSVSDIAVPEKTAPAELVTLNGITVQVTDKADPNTSSVNSYRQQQEGVLPFRVLFVVTDEFVDSFPDTNSEINERVAITNAIYQSSGMNVELINAAFVQVDLEGYSVSQILDNIAISGNSDSTLGQIPVSTLEPIWDARINAKADFVAVLVKDLSAGLCGRAWLNGSERNFKYNLAVSVTAAFAVEANHYCDSDTLAHEIGHNIGLTHSLRQGDVGVVFPYGRGYGIDDQFTTVMAYTSSFGTAESVPFFSSPNQICHDNLPCGVDASETDGADAVLAVNRIKSDISLIFHEATTIPFSDAISNFSISVQDCITSAYPYASVNKQVTRIRCLDDTLSSFEGVDNFTELSLIAVAAEDPDLTPFLNLQKIASLDFRRSRVTSLRPVTHLINQVRFLQFSAEDMSCQDVKVAESWPISTTYFLNSSRCNPLDSDTEDYDQDGINNLNDIDDDNDGIDDITDHLPYDSRNANDIDADGVIDSSDAFPHNAAEQTDTDHDGIGNNSDLDDDNDGVADTQDCAPLDRTQTTNCNSSEGQIEWSYPVGGAIQSSPAIGEDGTIYIGSTLNALHAIDPDGSLKWTFDTDGKVESSPAIGVDGTLYVGSDRGFYAINSDGSLKWKYDLSLAVESSPAIGNGNTIYVGSLDNSVHAINADGTLKWQYQTGGDVLSSPAIDADGTIYVGSNDEYLHAINPDGSLKWRYKTSGDVRSSPAIDENGNVYVGSHDKYLHAVNSDGVRIWRFETDGRIEASPVISESGAILIGSRDASMYSISKMGDMNWSFRASSEIWSTAAIDNNGNAYFGSNSGLIYAVDANGSEQWQFDTDSDVWSSPAITDDGLLVIASRNGNLYALTSSGDQLADSPWPKFRYSNRGVSNPYISDQEVEPEGQRQWFYEVNSDIHSTPALGNDGAVYFGSFDRNFYALNPDGSLKWSYLTNDRIYSSPAVNGDGEIFVGSDDNRLYAFNPDGTKKWHYETQGNVRSSPAISSDETIYVGSMDHSLYAINPNGSLKWTYKTDGSITASPSIGADGTIYIGSYDNKIHAINSDGTLKWSYNTGHNIYSSAAIDDEGVIYVASWDDYLYALNSNGTLKWRYKTTVDIQSSPAIGVDGTIYFCSRELYAINSDGSLKWSFSPSNIQFHSSPTIGADGTIYAGANDGLMYALDADGGLKWSHATDGNIRSGAALSDNGRLYFGTYSNQMIALSVNSNGLANSSWPKFGKNNKNTANLFVDSDADGLSDSEEMRIGTDPFDSDTDNDGLNDGLEVNTYNTDPLDSDSDDDGLNDGVEVNTHNTDPLDSDSDDDGLTDGLEVNTHNTDPRDSDTDDDGLSDGLEVNTHNTDPKDSDTDDDGLSDGLEVNTHNTDPRDSDTDDDGLSDGLEVNTHNTDPRDSDTDDDGLSDGLEVNTHNTDPRDSDTDDDGLSDGLEVNTHNTDPRDSDTDDDGLSDGEEVNDYGSDPNNPDTDGDGIVDGEDEDPITPANNPVLTPAFLMAQTGYLSYLNVENFLPLNADSYSFSEGGKGMRYSIRANIGSDAHEFEWSVSSEGKVMISNMGLSTSLFSDSPPYNLIANIWGNEVANQLNQAHEQGLITDDIFEIESGVVAENWELVDTKPLEYQFNVTRTSRLTLKISDDILQGIEGGWQGSTRPSVDTELAPTHFTYMYQTDPDINIFTQEDMPGMWGVPLFYDLNVNPVAFPENSAYRLALENFYHDLVILNETSAYAILSDKAFTWIVEDGVLQLSSGNEQFIIKPIRQLENEYLVSAEYLVDGELRNMKTALMVKADASGESFVENIITDLPEVYTSLINEWRADSRNTGGTIECDNIFAYHYQPDGQMRRGIQCEEGNLGQYFDMGTYWSWEAENTDLIVSTYENGNINRQRQWRFLSGNSHGRTAYLELEYSASDLDNDGVFTSDEHYYLIRPRINFQQSIELDSYNPSAWDNTDVDEDGLTNREEWSYGTDIYSADSDGDGLSDGAEVNTYSTDPRDSDTDDDGLSDGEEINTHNTDPKDSDTDDDGYSDGDEVSQGTLPTDPNDYPGSGSSTNIELDWFTDVNMRQCVSATGISEVEALTSLYCDYNNITVLTGIEKLAALRELSLSANDISDFSALGTLPDLIILALHSNNISDISFLSGLADLSELNLASNNISDISVLSGLTNLSELNLASNNIADISILSGLTNLSELSLASNNITDISVLSGLTKLYFLRLGFNSITDVSILSGLTNLSILEIEFNNIADINVMSGLTNLSYLNLQRNNITDISALSGVPNLRTVHLSENNIIDISVLSGLSNLSFLSLSRNNISDISALAEANNLRYLYLGDNSITDISALSGLTNLINLGLNENNITDISILSGLTNLYELNLEYNNITDISVLRSLTNLSELNLRFNNITDISDLSGLINLSELNLGFNSITEINAVSELTNLEALYLRDNPVNNLSPLSVFTNLSYLSVSTGEVVSNDLSPVTNMLNLVYLNMPNSDLGSEDIASLASLQKLQWLYLDGNNISDLSIFPGFQQLQRLGLSNNTISDISYLSELTTLESLSLQHNQISNISALLELLGLRFLGLTGNDTIDCADLAVLNETLTNTQIAQPESCSEAPKTNTMFDFDGDNKADVAVRRPSTFLQYIARSSDQDIGRIEFGKRTKDIPVSGDFDGDGITDVAVRRPSNKTWYIKNSSDGQIQRIVFGLNENDIPVPADYDGDGITDLAVRRPSNQFWYIRNSSGVDHITGHTDGITRLNFGRQEEDISVPADYDGDGKADIAVRRPSNQMWYVRNSSGVDYITGNTDGITRLNFGRQAEDIPVPADYDGDGKTDIAVRRPSTQFWYIRNSSDGEIQRIQFGRQSGDIPIPADYDGDGKADVAVRRPSSHFQYVLNSSDNQIQRIHFGRDSSDIPLAAPVSIRMNMVNGDAGFLRSALPETEVMIRDIITATDLGLVVEKQPSTEF